jgi:hypothetical protein
MAAGDSAAPEDDRSGGDVLRMLRTGTTAEHEAVERTLDLLDPGLGRGRLAAVLGRLHGFWLSAEHGLDVFHQPDGATILVIGDVAGPDTAAAACMGQARGLLRGIA